MPRAAPHMPLKLAEAAFEKFATNGFSKVNLDEVAVQAGVTKGSIYCHYKSKHDLVLAACMHYYRTYQEKVHEVMAQNSEPLDRLRKVLELSVHNCVIDQKNRVFTTGIFALSLQFDDVRSSWLQFYDTVRELFIGLVTAAKHEGKLEVEDPRFAVDMMLAAIEGIKLRATFEPHIADSIEQQNLVFGLLEILGYRDTASSRRGNELP